MIIGITGFCVDDQDRRCIAGAGKDAAASRLTEKHEFVRIGLADPLKRVCEEIFEFSDKQLWGPSEARNAPDFRYPRGAEEYRVAYQREVDAAQTVLNTDPEKSAQHMREAQAYSVLGWLTPRHALQQLGTEFGRACYDLVWTKYALRVAKKLEDGGYYYDPKVGLRSWTTFEDSPVRAKTNVVFSDIRFYNEAKAVHEAGGKLVRIKRRMPASFIDQFDVSHPSETQLSSWDDHQFDYVIENNGSLHDLSMHVDRMLDIFKGKIRMYQPDQEDIPPALRQ